MIFRDFPMCLLPCFVTLWLACSAAAQEESAAETGGKTVTASISDTEFQYYQEIELPVQSAAKYFDFLLPVSVFDGSRYDLGDLRLRDASGVEIPFALRIRKPGEERVPIAAREFNRTRAADRTAELTLDLGENGYEHNEVEVHTAGDNFRRHATVEGSANEAQWRPLAEKNLVKFSTSSGNLDDFHLTYAPSRFRYLRVRVAPDPTMDRDPITITEAKVRRTVLLPGEFVFFEAPVSEREPVRTSGRVPGSAWRIDLGGNNVPCKTLLVEIANTEFNREYEIKPIRPTETSERVEWSSAFASGTWVRRPSEPVRPMEADLGDAVASRLKLLIADHANQPLTVTSVKFSAPARQLIFANEPSLHGPLRLYFGNPAAPPPQYDFDRNLPPTLVPDPERLELANRKSNPAYVPPPKPLTERWPWLIYVVLGAVSLTLAVIIAGLAQAAIVRHDARVAAT